jgi:hypothetical protein
VTVAELPSFYREPLDHARKTRAERFPMPKKSPSKKSSKKPTAFTSDATFDLVSAVSAIEAELPSDVTIQSDMWKPTWTLVHKLFTDRDPFWAEHCAVEGLIQDKSGNRIFNRYDSASREMWTRLVRTAYVVG